jgi:hypothetical protein
MTTYIVIDISTQVSLIDFIQVNTTNAQTMRRNLANTQGMISYITTPSFITDGTVTPVSSLTHDEALELLATDAWTDPSIGPT